MKKPFKKLISVIAAGAAFAAVSGFPAFAGPKYVRITGNPVAVRAEAGTDGRFLRQVSAGNQFDYLSEKTSGGTVWYQIRLTDGRTGWVTSAYAKTGEAKAIGQIRVTTKLLNVRATPSMSGDILDTTRQGTKYDYYATKKDAEKQTWYQVQYSESQTAWLLGTFCEEITPAKDTKQEDNKKEESVKAPKQIEVTSTPVNVRAAASLDGEKLGRASRGDRFKCLSAKKDAKNNLWYQVQYTAKQKGWIMAKFCQEAAETGSTKPTKEIKQVEISQTPVNIRASASLEGEKLGRAVKGNRFAYVSQTKDKSGTVWYQVQYTAKQKGWVIGSLSKVVTDGAKGTAMLSNSYKVTIKTYSADNGRIKCQYPQISGLYDPKMQEYYNARFLSETQAAAKKAGKGKLKITAKTVCKTKDALSVLFTCTSTPKNAAKSTVYSYAVNIDLATGGTFVPSDAYGAEQAAKAVLDGKWTLVNASASATKAKVKKYFASSTKKTVKAGITQTNVVAVKRNAKGNYTVKGKNQCKSYTDSKGSTVLILSVSRDLGDNVMLKLK